MALESVAPSLPYVILRAGLCFVVALIWLVGASAARADGPPLDPGVRLLRRQGPDLSLFVRRAPETAAAWVTPPSGSARSGRGPPVCVADVCQPRISVPGIEPNYRSGSRTDAVLAMLAGSPFGAVSRVARALSNVRLDYSPTMGVAGERGWGKVVLSLRWRIDAAGAPSN